MKKSVLVIGDIALDCCIKGSAERLSPEATCPLITVSAKIESPGCAANVAVNTAALGCQTHLITIFSKNDDDYGTNAIKTYIENDPLISLHAYHLDGFTVPIKTRVSDDRGRQLIRYDQQDKVPFSDERANQAVVKQVERLLFGKYREDDINCVILSDYGKGVLTDDIVVSEIIALARKARIPTIVDPKSKDLIRYKGCTIITPNAKEAAIASGNENGSPEYSVSELGLSLCKTGLIEAVLVTAGHDGMFLCSVYTKKIIHIPAYPPQIICDVTGAGDTVVACLAREISVNNYDGLLPNLELIARKASVGAGFVVGLPGTAVLHQWDYEAALAEHQFIPSVKIVDVEVAKIVVKETSSAGKKIVFANGCFDMLHPGHIAYLQAARRLGDLLVVAVNDDDSVRTLKGPRRPIFTLEHRIAMLAALECVDLVVPFSEGGLQAVIENIAPDVLAKCEEYKTDDMSLIPGAELILALGGEVIFIQSQYNLHTTDIINNLTTEAYGSVDEE